MSASVPLRVLVVADDPPIDGLATSAGHTLIAAALLPRWIDAGVVVELVSFASNALQDLPPWWPQAATLLPTGGRKQPLLPQTAAARATSKARRVVAAASARADVTFLHGLPTFALAQDVVGPIVANEIDPHSLYWRDRAKSGSPMYRAAGTLRQVRLARLERQASGRAARYCVVNAADAVDLARLLRRRVDVIPNGVPQPSGAPSPMPERFAGRQVLTFSGTLSYAPNIDSALTLAREVLPLVQRAVPSAVVAIAGRRPPQEITALEAFDVAVLVDIPDTLALHAAGAAGVFPGGFGRGTRNSVLETISAGKPVVASAASARGLARGAHLMVAESSEDIAAAVCRLLLEPIARKAALAAAARAAAQLPSWDSAATQYLDLLKAAAESAAPRR